MKVKFDKHCGVKKHYGEEKHLQHISR